MKRILVALLSALFLFSCTVSLAEEPADTLPPLATSTDLCAHEHTHTDYYFDAPVYRPLNSANHTVSGRATVQEVCEDCGAVLSTYIERNAETTFPHVFRWGQCVLCGYEGKKKNTAAAAVPTEAVLLLPKDEEQPNQFFCTLTGKDLDESPDTLVLRPEGCEAAIALQTERLRQEIDRTGGTLTAEIESPGAGDVTASVRLYTAEGEESAPEAEDLSLRIYSAYNGEILVVSFTDPEGNGGEEEAKWVTPEDSEAYWQADWMGDGTYTY